MSAGYRIAIQSEIRNRIDQTMLARLARKAMHAERVRPPRELSIVLTDDRTIRRLNRAYRATNAATDVLSFSQDEGHALTTVGPAHMGDVVISVETARAQAAQHRIALREEVAHLLVHGILHLLGHDHERPADAALMRAREEAILGAAHHH